MVTLEGRFALAGCIALAKFIIVVEAEGYGQQITLLGNEGELTLPRASPRQVHTILPTLPAAHPLSGTTPGKICGYAKLLFSQLSYNTRSLLASLDSKNL
jgi:hypothetical protein